MRAILSVVIVRGAVKSGSNLSFIGTDIFAAGDIIRDAGIVAGDEKGNYKSALPVKLICFTSSFTQNCVTYSLFK